MSHILNFEDFLNEAVDPKLKGFNKNYAAICIEKEPEKTFDLYVVPLNTAKFLEKDHGLKQKDSKYLSSRTLEELTDDLKDDFIGTFPYPSFEVYSPAGIEVYYDVLKD